MLKKVLALLLSILMVSSMFVGCTNEVKQPSNGQPSSADSSEEIKIGAILTLTGEIATMGQSMKNSLDLVIEEQNAKGGLLGRKVTAIYEDDQQMPPNAANAIQKLINNDKVVAIFGPTASKCAIAAGPIATDSKIPMIAPASTNPKTTTEGGEYVFRASFIDPFQGTVLAKFALENLNVKTAAVLYDIANDYSKGLAEFFKAGFEENGGQLLAYESYSTFDLDFNAQLTNIKKLNPEVLLIPDNYNPAGLIAKQARAQGIDAIILGGDGFDSPELYELGGDAVNGSYFSTHYSPSDTSPAVVEFIEKYEAKYNKVPDSFAVLGYDAAKILFNAIEKSGTTDGTKIKDEMVATELQAVSGKITYDENRDPIKGAVILKVVGDKTEFETVINP